jgi:hypothetical protein
VKQVMKFKSWTLPLTLALATAAHPATNHITPLFQKGLFLE